ncbi:unnamed protein product [Merluccius merluccius]
MHSYATAHRCTTGDATGNSILDSTSCWTTPADATTCSSVSTSSCGTSGGTAQHSSTPGAYDTFCRTACYTTTP